MKYLITESQIDNVIFKYLDNQDFVMVGDDISLFFVNSESDEYAQIRYDENDEWCFISYKLVNEISSFFSLRESNSKKVIGKWVENTLKMKVTNIFFVTEDMVSSLRTPN